MTKKQIKKLIEEQDKLYNQLTFSLSDSDVKKLNKLLGLEIIIISECNQ